MSQIFKIAVMVPESHADKVREAMGNAGAGIIGKYTHCTYTTKVTGRFMPLPGADPADGEVNSLETVTWERIETTCEEEKLQDVKKAILENHPYEEVSIEISDYKLL